MATSTLQFEFRHAISYDVTHNAAGLCEALLFVANATANCTAPITSEIMYTIDLVALQIPVTAFDYENQTIVDELSHSLHVFGFFTLPESTLTGITALYRGEPVVVTLAVVLTVIVLILIGVLSLDKPYTGKQYMIAGEKDV